MLVANLCRGCWMTFHATFRETFVEYPPSQTPASFTIDQIQESVDKRIEQKQKKR